MWAREGYDGRRKAPLIQAYLSLSHIYIMKNNRLIWPDLLKIIAIYAVIIIHTAAPLLIRYKRIGMEGWWIANIYESLSRWCIPVFFMLSGAFLIEKAGNETAGKFFFRRSQKIIIPFIIWSALYFVWRIYVNGEDLLWWNFVPLLFQEPIYYHLWYIYILIELYLLAPILGIYVKGASAADLTYFLLLWFIFGSIIPLFQSCCNLHTYFTMGEYMSVFNYVGYFLLGYVLRGVKLKWIQAVLFLLLFVLGFVISAYGTYYLMFQKNENRFLDSFYQYFSANVMAMSISIYLLFKSIPFPTSAGGIIRSVGACVPGIYFIHAMIIAILKRGMLGITFSDRNFYPVVGIPLFALVVFVISFFIIQIIRLIPGLKYTVP